MVTSQISTVTAHLLKVKVASNLANWNIFTQINNHNKSAIIELVERDAYKKYCQIIVPRSKWERPKL